MGDHPFTIRQLEYFDAVAVHGTLARAAEQCNVTASGLAIALDELERNLGAQLLLRRRAKGVSLTPIGRDLLADVRTILGNAGELSAHARRDGTGIGGRLSVGCYPSLSPFYLPGILQEFGREHPALSLEFVEGAADELQDYLTEGRAEVALMYSAHISGELEIEAVDSYPPYALVAGNSPLAALQAVSLSELAEHPLIALDLPPSQQNTEHLFATAGLHPVVTHRSVNFELVRCLVGRGLGYTIMFQHPAQDETYDGRRLARLRLTDFVPSTTVGLAHVGGTRLTRRTTALLEYLRSHPKVGLAV